ncbi:MAG: hypothetical protein MZU84_04680 [Sphingobacterium sp.]|nr:hypothetical protein [Sphingobacterium sp.]
MSGGGDNAQAESAASSAGSARRWSSPRSRSGSSGRSGTATRYWGAWAGLVCVLIYTLSQWRDIARRVPPAADAPRHAHGGERRHRPRRSSWPSTTSGVRQNKRWDLTEGGRVHALGPDGQRPARRWTRRSRSRPSRRPRRWRGSRTACRSTGSRRSRCRSSYVDPDREAGRRRGSTRCSRTAPSCSSTRAAPSASSATPSRT